MNFIQLHLVYVRGKTSKDIKAQDHHEESDPTVFNFQLETEMFVHPCYNKNSRGDDGKGGQGRGDGKESKREVGMKLSNAEHHKTYQTAM